MEVAESTTVSYRRANFLARLLAQLPVRTGRWECGGQGGRTVALQSSEGDHSLNILKRLRPHRPIGAVVAAMLGVVSILGATLGFAGTASANLISTPIVGNAVGLISGGSANSLVAGKAGQPGQILQFALSDTGTVTSSVTSGTWANGDSINIPVFPAGGATNNVTTGDYVEYTSSSVPSLLCIAGGAGVTQPTFNVTFTTNPNDTAADITAGLTDLMKITFTDSPSIGSATDFLCYINGIQYTTGGAVPAGGVAFVGTGTPLAPCVSDEAVYEQGTAPNGTCPVDGTSIYEQALTVASNGTVVLESITANSPAISVLPFAKAAPISNIVITETAPAEVDPAATLTAPQYVCITSNTGTFGLTATSPTITVTPSNVGGTATISPAITGVTGTIGAWSTIAFEVLTPSSTVPTTFTLAGITVNAPGTVGPVTATVLQNVTSVTGGTCTGGTPETSTLQIYAVGQPTGNTRIAGSTADQTAVASLENEYPPHPGFCIPAGIFAVPARPETGSSVVLATDGSWQDALTASYLAAWLHTGVLLTPTDSLSTYAAIAIQQEGVSNVVIVGGTLAVSQAVQNQLAATPAYNCGGATPMLNALGQPINLNVQRIAGVTADGTAAAVATYVDSGYVNDLNISGSFKNALGGPIYNDTLGTDSGSAPTIAVRTAILVTDNSYQDAASAAPLAYAEHLPILLTPQASLGTDAETALLDLGIQQVIELGGPLAISNSVNASLISQGISVLRIAGADGSENRYGVGNGIWTGTGTTSGAFGSCTGTATFGPINYSTGCTVVVGLARGDFFADALTSAVVTGRNHEPVILAENPTTLGSYATSFFNTSGNGYGVDPQFVTPPVTMVPSSGTTVSSITVFGGPLAIAQSTLQAALNAISAG
jgi:putative cell wall-binding protein